MGRSRIGGKGRPLALWLALCATGGCADGPPEGQVLARAGDEDVTRAEIAREAATPRGADEDAARAALNATLEAVVDRKLLARRAREQGLHRDPDLHFALRAARERLLVDALRNKVARTLGDPGDAAIAAFVDANPAAFDGRALLTLRDPDGGTVTDFDTVVLAGSADGAVPVREPGATLRLSGVEWLVVARTPVDMSRQDQVNLARSLLKNRMIEREIDRIVAEERDATVIRYQPGWGPGGR